MMNRSYLPYQSARQYADRGMAKWMGFFLSEHTSSLLEDKLTKRWQETLTREEKLELLMQLYVAQLDGFFSVREPHQLRYRTGKVRAVSESSAYVVNETEGVYVPIDQIQDIQLAEVIEDESARVG